ncbi:hypothetical protein [Ralstonia wenshanensis]|uniref:hypothetical protein n=1 Tax=Ralstonia wenshanensis TaxID=2842456 RepID=UPI003D982AF4
MTDRELVRLAAKAAGLDVECAFIGGDLHIWASRRLQRLRLWNPLMDDGDALRLAVSLGLIVSCDASPCIAVSSERYPSIHIVESAYGGDVQQATRRAIVRVAAKIGSRM